MDLYLAGVGVMEPYFRGGNINASECSVLCSYYGISDFEIEYLARFGKVIIDSGAFSFMNGRKANVDFDTYTEKYAEFVTRNNIQRFFELDIDCIVGLREVERLRKKLENLTGKQPIPVWHKSRGKDYFQGMARDYPYVAIGGIVTQEIPRKTYEAAFPWFIRIAHEAGSKVHGLGYTSIEGITKYHFDSVDSTTWNVGAKYGNICRIFRGNDGGWIGRQEHRPGTRVKVSRELAKLNFDTWLKFSKYAEKYL